MKLLSDYINDASFHYDRFFVFTNPIFWVLVIPMIIIDAIIIYIGKLVKWIKRTNGIYFKYKKMSVEELDKNIDGYNKNIKGTKLDTKWLSKYVERMKKLRNERTNR